MWWNEWRRCSRKKTLILARSRKRKTRPNFIKFRDSQFEVASREIRLRLAPHTIILILRGQKNTRVVASYYVIKHFSRRRQGFYCVINARVDSAGDDNFLWHRSIDFQWIIRECKVRRWSVSAPVTHWSLSALLGAATKGATDRPTDSVIAAGEREIKMETSSLIEPLWTEYKWCRSLPLLIYPLTLAEQNKQSNSLIEL